MMNNREGTDLRICETLVDGPYPEQFEIVTLYDEDDDSASTASSGYFAYSNSAGTRTP